MGMSLESHIGETYGHLTITGIDRERRQKENSRNSYVFADCDCGVCGKSYALSKLRNGTTKSCGHLKIKHDNPNKRNKIEIFDDFGVIYTKTNKYKFDLEDLNYLKSKYWYSDSNGYLTHCYCSNRKNHYIRFHRLITNASKDEYVDHIDRDVTNNRKSNLRICKHKENDRNNNLYVTNKSGVIGVCWDKYRKKWLVTITYDYKNIYIGRFNNLEDAIKARLIKELELFKDFAPQIHLLDKYFSEEELNEIRKNKCI